MPWGPDGMSHAVFDGQLLVHLPTILSEPIERGGDPRRNRLAAEFRIVVERSEQCIPDSRARGASIQKAARPVLVDGRWRRGGGEFHMAFCTRIPQQLAEL